MINYKNSNSHFIHYFCYICIVIHYFILYHHQETYFSSLWYIQKWKFHFLNYSILFQQFNSSDIIKNHIFTLHSNHSQKQIMQHSHFLINYLHIKNTLFVNLNLIKYYCFSWLMNSRFIFSLISSLFTKSLDWNSMLVS